MWCLKPKGGRNAGILQEGKSASVMLLSNLAALSVNGMQLQLVQALSVRACLRC